MCFSATQESLALNLQELNAAVILVYNSTGIILLIIQFQNKKPFFTTKNSLLRNKSCWESKSGEQVFACLIPVSRALFISL